MSQKMDFVERAAAGEKVADLCREFGVSRQTGHKWIKRFEQQGHDGLEERSRRPRSAPLATAEELVLATLREREAHPRWGPDKLHGRLRKRFGDQTPSRRTIARILQRANKIRERRKRRPISVVDRAPAVVANAPNDVWTADFKGWWRTTNGDRCEPLTVRDGFSRFVLATVACSTKQRDVRPIFERLFRRYGVPKAIQCDNGTPFVSVHSRAGLSTLSAWWVSLGIRLVRSRPGCPQDNGAHERMHADVRADVQAYPAATRDEQQRALDRWRQEFNHVRPHQALGGKTPSEVYKVTERRRAIANNYDYPKHFYVRRISAGGVLYFRGDRCPVGAPFAGLQLAIQVIDALRLRLWLRDLDLGVIETTPGIEDSYFEATTVRPTGRMQETRANARRGGLLDRSSASPSLTETP